MNSTTLDWVIVVAYLTGSLGAGLYGKKFITDVSDFLVAGRELGTYVGVATLAATEIGTITFMCYAELGAVFIASTAKHGVQCRRQSMALNLRRMRCFRRN